MLNLQKTKGIPVFTPEIASNNVFWVDSGGDGDNSPNAGTWELPFKTIDYAVGKCTASKGDIIYVKPGHAETIASATTLALDVIGVQVIGLGGLTKRPALTFSTTASQIIISAADVTVRNIQFKNAVDSLVAGISVTAAGCVIENCAFTSPTATNDALIWVITAAGADDLVFKGNDIRGNNAGPTEAIRLVGTDRAKILDNYITGSYSTADINGITTASTELLIAGNTLTNSVTDALLIDLVAACTGRIEHNNGTVVSTGAWTFTNIIDPSSCQLAENYVSDAVGETGKLAGTVSA